MKKKPLPPTYGRAGRWCGAVVAVGLVAQHLIGSVTTEPTVSARVLLGAAVAGVFFAFVAARSNPRRSGDLLVSTPFITTVLGLLTGATIAGTLVVQRVAAAQFDAKYGAAAGLMRWVFLDDLFHSLWFSGLIWLTCLSLVVIAIRRWPWTWSKAGYVVTHLGVVVIALGALVGQLGGVKGRIDTEVGRVTSHMRTHDWRSGRVEGLELPFTVRLDDFRIEAHDPVYRIYVFERKAPGEHSDAFEPVLAIAPDEQQGEPVVVDRGVSLRVDGYVGEGAAAASAQHILKINGSTLVVEPHQAYADVAGRYIRVGEFYPHFNFDLASKQARNLSPQPVNPALYVEIRQGSPDGAVEHQGWLFAHASSFDAAHGRAEHTDRPVYHFAGAAAGPGVELAVLEGGREVAKGKLTLEQRHNALRFQDGRFVAVFRQRDREAKNYHSTLSILDGDHVLATKQIKVNEPLFYGGYAFYQANFDPKNLRYSGIEVVRDPGLWLVFVGLVAVLLGVVQIFYFRALGKRRREVRA